MRNLYRLFFSWAFFPNKLVYFSICGLRQQSTTMPLDRTVLTVPTAQLKLSQANSVARDFAFCKSDRPSETGRRNRTDSMFKLPSQTHPVTITAQTTSHRWHCIRRIRCRYIGDSYASQVSLIFGSRFSASITATFKRLVSSSLLSRTIMDRHPRVKGETY